MSEKQHGMLRKFNQAVLNPITKLFAGNFFYALVYHKGRLTGRAYSTPVVAVKKGQTIFCPLPYGLDTDWFLNIMVAGKCEVKINGIVYSAADFEVVDEAAALPHFSPAIGRALKRAKIKNYLRLRIQGNDESVNINS